MSEDTSVSAKENSDDDARKDYEFSGLNRLGSLDKVTQTGGNNLFDGTSSS